MTEISQDQGRIRENMSKIDGSSQLYARYMTKLSEQETKLEDLTERRKQNQASVDKMQSELNEYIRTLNVD